MTTSLITPSMLACFLPIRSQIARLSNRKDERVHMACLSDCKDLYFRRVGYLIFVSSLDITSLVRILLFLFSIHFFSYNFLSLLFFFITSLLFLLFCSLFFLFFLCFPISSSSLFLLSLHLFSSLLFPILLPLFLLSFSSSFSTTSSLLP